MISKNIKIFLAGHNGMVGSAIFNKLKKDGYNNFVQRNNPLGWLYGSDSRENIIGINWAHKNMLLSKLEIGNRQDGEKNFINDLYSPYTTYLQNKFPSGNFENLNFISYEFNLWLKEYLSIFGHVGYYNSNKIGSYSDLSIGIDMYYPMSRIF